MLGIQGVGVITVGMNTSPVSQFATPTVIKGAPGILVKVLVTTTIAANAIVFYDNTTNSGTIIGYIAAGTGAGGNPFAISIPANQGIVVASAAGPTATGAITVSYI